MDKELSEMKASMRLNAFVIGSAGAGAAGDRFCAVDGSAADFVACCVACRRRDATRAWPDRKLPEGNALGSVELLIGVGMGAHGSTELVVLKAAGVDGVCLMRGVPTESYSISILFSVLARFDGGAPGSIGRLVLIRNGWNRPLLNLVGESARRLCRQLPSGGVRVI